MRTAPMPDFDSDDIEDEAVAEAMDVAADAFYNGQTRSCGSRNSYAALVAVDELLQKRGLEIVMYESGSDHIFEIADYQAPEPVKRERGPQHIDIPAPTEVSLAKLFEAQGLDPALGQEIDDTTQFIDVIEIPDDHDEVQARKDAARLFPQPEDTNFEGVDKLRLNDVVALLKDGGIIGAEREALHRRLDDLVVRDYTV